MKQCPFCRAEIQENARFCLYCMRSLEDKQPAEKTRQYDRRWIVMIAVPIAAIILAVGIWALVRRPSTDPSVGSNAMTESADTSNAPSDSDTVTTVKTTAKRGSSTAATTRSNNGVAGKITTAKVKTTTRAIATQPSVHSSTTADTHKNNTVPSGDSASSKETASSGDSTSSKETVTSATAAPSAPDVTYLYRDARRGDDFYANATLENAVVITGVSTPSQNGTYVIPDTLDGKTVVAIMGFAFSDDNVRDTVKQVVVPAGVKTIWNYAFAECGQMSDIYFCGDAIYTEAFAFADVADRVGTLTIHCAASCNDRNFRYYKTSASNYDALYEEWNG